MCGGVFPATMNWWWGILAARSMIILTPFSSVAAMHVRYFRSVFTCHSPPTVGSATMHCRLYTSLTSAARNWLLANAGPRIFDITLCMSMP